MLEGKKDGWKAFVCLLPAMVVLVLFMFMPIIYSVLMSFMEDFDWAEGGLINFFANTYDSFPSIAGYKAVLEDNLFQRALLNTLILVVVSVPLTIIIGLLLAVALNSIKKLQGLYQTIFFLPYVTNGIALGMVFNVMFTSGSNGLINTLFNLGVFHWMDVNANHWSMLVVIAAFTVWNGLAFKILVFMSGLQNIDKQYYDAARIDGANKRKILTKITIPLLAPQILYITITSFIGAFKSYSSVISVFGAGPYRFGGAGGNEWITVVGYIYKAMGNNEIGGLTRAAAGSVVLLVIILACTLIQFMLKKRSSSISGLRLEKEAIIARKELAKFNKDLQEGALTVYPNANGEIVMPKEDLIPPEELTLKIKKGGK